MEEEGYKVDAYIRATESSGNMREMGDRTTVWSAFHPVLPLYTVI